LKTGLLKSREINTKNNRVRSKRGKSSFSKGGWVAKRKRKSRREKQGKNQKKSSRKRKGKKMTATIIFPFSGKGKRGAGGTKGPRGLKERKKDTTVMGEKMRNLSGEQGGKKIPEKQNPWDDCQGTHG